MVTGRLGQPAPVSMITSSAFCEPSMVSESLNELEGVVWGEPTFDSHLITTCYRLRTKPVDEFTVEDFRIMIGQKFSLDYLMPLAIVELEREPLAEGDCYPGDLLAKVIECGEWLRSHPELLSRVVAVAEHAAAELG